MVLNLSSGCSGGPLLSLPDGARRLRQTTLAPLPDAVDAAIMAVARQHRPI